MNTPHERLTRTTFSLPLGEVHALVGGAVNARPLLFLHGFPDHPPTAVPFLEHLAETHRVVAPWLRGYAPSPIVGPYDLDTLAADAIALIDRLGGQVDLVGHDWGGAITYTVCAAAPSHVRRAVTLAIPHPATLLRSLAHSKQWKKSWYMGLFQLPGAGYLVRRRELAMIEPLKPTIWNLFDIFQNARSKPADLHPKLRVTDRRLIPFWQLVEHVGNN